MINFKDFYNSKQEKRYTLNRIKNLLNYLYNPQDKIKNIIHVTGTNGKGSTIAFLKSIFENSGYSVNTFVSPHLIKINERISLLSEDISDKYLNFLYLYIKKKIERHKIQASFFEIIVAIAFLAFVEKKSDVVLLEVGIGGRLDATNVIKNTLCSIITPISYDHIHILGNDIKDIAHDKSQIIKKNSYCIISKQKKIVQEILKEKCRKEKSQYKIFNQDFFVQENLKKNNFTQIKNNTLNNKEFSFKYEDENYNMLIENIGLKGEHQMINASGAIATCSQLKHIFGFKAENIISGIKKTSLKGRLENIFSDTNLKIYYDGAHNFSGIYSISEWIKSSFQKKDLYVIMMINKKKDPQEFFKAILNAREYIKQIYLTSLKSEINFFSEEELIPYITEKIFSFSKSLEEAIKTIKEKPKDKKYILITGSLYIADKLYQLKKNNFI